MHKMLEESGLTPEDMNTKPMLSPPEGLTTLPGPGFIIPYFTQAGNPTKFYRYRYVKSPTTFGKPLRYVQPANLLPQVYWARTTPWKNVLASKDEPLFITEGEKKAACGGKFGKAVIGLGGVWSFKSNKVGVKLIDELAAIDWKERRVYVVYDNDAITNPMVVKAETALASELAMRGATVYLVRLPEGNAKGLDDFLVAYGVDEFQALIDDPYTTIPFAEGKALHELNAEVVYVENPSLVWRPRDGYAMDPNIFTNQVYRHLTHDVEEPMPKGGTKVTVKRTAKVWMEWSGKSRATSLVYEPGKEMIVDGSLNTWGGWACEPKEGDLRPWFKLFNFVMEGATDAEKKWFEQWLAYPIQHPGTKLYSAVVVWSLEQGTGKTFIAHIMAKIYGKNFSEITGDHLNDSFNEWAANRQFVLGEEIGGAENRRVMADRLKKMITQPTILVNAKYVRQYTIRDCLNYYFTTNHPNAFYIEDTDRRFFIHEIRGLPMVKSEYDRIDEWKNGDGPAALLHHLLHVDLTGFGPMSAPPVTEAKKEMSYAAKSEVERWAAQLKGSPEGVLVCAGANLNWSVATGTDLYKLYDPEGRRNQIIALSNELRKAQIPRACDGKQIKLNGQMHRVWVVSGDKERIRRMTPQAIAELYNKEHGDGSRKF